MSDTAPQPAEAARDLYHRVFGSHPRIVATAPARVNLIGEHLDYNGGPVLPMAIGLRTAVAVGPAAGAVSRAVSRDEGETGQFTIESVRPSGSWWDYVAGVARALARAGVPPSAFDLAVASDIPRGGGLSSSAALEVASAGALLALAGEGRPPEEIARVAHRAEVDFVGVPCGIMDQYASALSRRGHALHLDSASGAFAHVAMPHTVLVFDTGVPRSLRVSAFAERRAECDAALRLLREVRPSLPNLAAASLEELGAARLPDPLDRRARHVADEVARVEAAVGALRNGVPLPGELLHASHESLRTLFECSTPELDWFVARMRRTRGVTGARLTGAGWGGCALAVGEPAAMSHAAGEIGGSYEEMFGLTCRTWISSAAGGLSVAYIQH